MTVLWLRNRSKIRMRGMGLNYQQCARSYSNHFAVVKPYLRLSQSQNTLPFVGSTAQQRRLFSCTLFQERKSFISRSKYLETFNSQGSHFRICCLHTTHSSAVADRYGFSSLASSTGKVSEFAPDISPTEHLNEFSTNSPIEQLPSFDSSEFVDIFASELNNATAVGPETLASLGLGSNFTPVGWVQQTLEVLHVSAGLPWWGSIACATVIFRTLLFPLALKGIKNGIKAQAFQAELLPLQQKIVTAQNQMTKELQEKLMKEYADLLKKHGNPIIKMLSTPLIQAPLFISFFLALRKMAEVPVASLTTGGVMWFPDLTIPDPYHILPFVSAGTILLALELGFSDTGVSMQQQQRFAKYMLRGMCVIMVPIMWNFPAALVTYWVTSNIFTLFQGIFLRNSKVRTFFDIPGTPKPPLVDLGHSSQGPMKMSFAEEFKAAYEDAKKRKMKSMEEMERTKREQSETMQDNSQVEENRILFEKAKKEEQKK